MDSICWSSPMQAEIFGSLMSWVVTGRVRYFSIQSGWLYSGCTLQPSVDDGFSISYVFKTFGQFWIWAVAHLLVQILKVSGLLLSIRDTHTRPGNESKSSPMTLWGPPPEFLTLSHHPATFQLPRAPPCWSPSQTSDLYLPSSAVHFQQVCLYKAKGQTAKRSNGHLPTPSWDNSSSDWKRRFSLLRILVFWVLAATAIPTRKSVSQFLKPDLEGLSWSSLCLRQCPFLGVFIPASEYWKYNSPFLFPVQITLLNATLHNQMCTC